MKKTIIIGEAGVNHNGNIKLAKQLVDVAVYACLDYVKFQSFKAISLVTASAKKAQYQKGGIDSSEASQQELLKKLELNQRDHLELYQYCRKKKIGFLSSPFDLESIDMLAALKLDYWKIPSGEITNLPYLRKIAGYGGKILLSTGMSTIEEIGNALRILQMYGTRKKDIIVLHCNTEYPTPLGDVNLNAMHTIKNTFGVEVGYSDHTQGIIVPIAAVCLGAAILEKHFTLDKTLPGPDHRASLEPEELMEMVKAIRDTETILGIDIKKPSKSEKRNIVVIRKSIHLKKALPEGHIICEEDLIMKRPGNGISPMDLEQVIGKKTIKELPVDHKISWDDIYKQ